MQFDIFGDRVVVAPEDVATVTESGIHIPEGAQEVWRYGDVVKVGWGHHSEFNGESIPIDITEGSRVFFHKHSGQPITLDKVEYLLLQVHEVVGVVEGE